MLTRPKDFTAQRQIASHALKNDKQILSIERKRGNYLNNQVNTKEINEKNRKRQKEKRRPFLQTKMKNTEFSTKDICCISKVNEKCIANWISPY